MGWNDDALVAAGAFYVGWLASGLALVALLRIGSGPSAQVLAWTCITAQVIATARAVQVGFAPLATISLVFAGIGALALRRLRRAF
ncbi:MAG: hypothetical protein MSC31_18970 [Solirubrobacteraceae bacterium MAG38_C4-C5]|nr:hypothetical protein [Candidatus Siliceabacter maunaloa]